MTIKELLSILRSRSYVICLVVLSSLALGAAGSWLTPKSYEVFMLMEARQSSVSPYAYETPWIIHREIESGVLNKKAAQRAGVSPALPVFPKIRSKVMYETSLLRVYTYVPFDRIESAKEVLSALYDIVREEQLAVDNPQKQEALRAIAEVERLRRSKRDIDMNLRKTGLSPQMAKFSGDLARWVEDFSRVLRDFDRIAGEKGSIYDFRIRLVSPPQVSDTPVFPSFLQSMLASALLGMFLGAAIAHWLGVSGSK